MKISSLHALRQTETLFKVIIYIYTNTSSAELSSPVKVGGLAMITEISPILLDKAIKGIISCHWTVMDWVILGDRSKIL